MKTKMTPHRLVLDALLLGIALIIYTLEMQLPSLTPVPGIKLGLSNIITVYALFTLGPLDAVMILICRILLGSVFGGNVSAMMYSAAGGALSLGCMLLLRPMVSMKHIAFLGAFAAVLHGLGQMLVAVLLTRSSALWAYFPFLVLSGLIAGFFTGLCAQLLSKRLGVDTLFKKKPKFGDTKKDV